MQALRAATYSIHNQTPVESRQLPFVGTCQRQQIAISHLAGTQQTFRVYHLGVQQADIVWPKHITGECSQALHQLCYLRWRAWRIRIAGMTHNAQHTILRQWAGCPRPFPLRREPPMRRIVLDMRWINQRDQHVYIEQKTPHGNSSRN